MKNISSAGILLSAALAVVGFNSAFAQNPIIRDQYSADPSARVFGDKVYLYPSHDILATPGKGRVDWFCMEDYHVFSSANLTDWADHGMIVTQNKVPWVQPNSYAMWAPDCIERNGKYYFYFPATVDSSVGRGFGIGVAVADNPAGPFIPEAKPIAGVHGIDPNIFIDKDGQAYLYYSQGNIYVAKLKENMLELASDPVILKDLPQKGLKEGPYFFERNGKYYLTFPHVENTIERLEYAMGDNPLGPFKMTGVIMDESPSNCWTVHHSVINFKNQWYLFYHDRDYSPNFDKARSVRLDSLSFNEDGTIRKVIPTLRGAGVNDATKPVQIDRYSSISAIGVTTSFVDTTDRFKGWQANFESKDGWLQYDNVDFGTKALKSITVMAKSTTGGTLLVRQSPAGPVIAEVKVPAGSNNFSTVKAPVKNVKTGKQNLFLSIKDDDAVAVDWVSFE